MVKLIMRSPLPPHGSTGPITTAGRPQQAFADHPTAESSACDSHPSLRDFRGTYFDLLSSFLLASPRSLMRDSFYPFLSFIYVSFLVLLCFWFCYVSSQFSAMSLTYVACAGNGIIVLLRP